MVLDEFRIHGIEGVNHEKSGEYGRGTGYDRGGGYAMSCRSILITAK